MLTVDLDSSSQLADASRISFGEEVIDARGQARLAVKRPGLHVLRFECTGDPGAAAVFRSIRIQVSAEAAAGAGVVRKRWRPAAAHARFRSDRANGSKTRLWIMEMDAVPGSLDFYAPITTPFGYYGPTWNADGTVGSSFNFSLWSYGRGKEAPPLDKLSHLLAIGHRDATFGGYGHEGTGVKIRDWKPLEGRSGQRQVLALRLEPGGPGSTHDTYCSYFYAADEKRWRLYGVGRSNRGGRARSVESLTLGSFVEVPGRASTQRTGVYERRMRYRGWLVDTEGTLSPIDRMSTGDVDRETGLTYTDRGITEDGWFTLATGGWGWRRPLPEKEVVLPAEISHAAPYLGAEDLRFLHRVPSSIEPTRVIREQGETSVEFEVRGLGGHAEAVVFWGERDGLSFVDAWENQAPVPQLREGKNQLILPGAAGDDALFVRLLLQSDQGQFWSMESRSP